MHIEKEHYGISGQRYARHVHDLAARSKAKSILDYGCGKRTLETKLKALWFGTPLAEVVNYDPGIPGLEHTRKPCDLVVCTDVLEHIEPELIDNVLDDLDAMMVKCGFFTICTMAANKHLPDGRNAHLILKPYTWWLQKLWSHFFITSFEHLLREERGVEGEMLIGVKKK